MGGGKAKWPGLVDMAGLWKINTISKEAKFFGHGALTPTWPEGIDAAQRDWMLWAGGALVMFEPKSEKFIFVFGRRPSASIKLGDAEITQEIFAPGFDELISGFRIYLRTSAIYKDKLWLSWVTVRL